MRSRLRSARWVAIALVVCLSGARISAGQTSTHKKPITHDVYDSWKSIQGTKLSRDGVWLAYGLTPQDGDGELVVRNLKTNAEHRAPRGRDPIITADTKFVVFSIAPFKSDVDKARKAKKRREDMPKGGVGVMDLATGQVTTLAEHVKSFRVPDEVPRYVAFLIAPPERRPGSGAAVEKSGPETTPEEGVSRTREKK